MTLFDLVGPCAIAGGLAAARVDLQRAHQASLGPLLAGAVAGIAILILIRMLIAPLSRRDLAPRHAEVLAFFLHLGTAAVCFIAAFDVATFVAHLPT